VCLHAGAGALNKQWPPEAFAGLIDLLVAEDGVNMALLGSAGERAIVDRVLGLVRRKDRVFSLVGRVALADLATVLRAAALFVGNDSGPKHLAAALGVPTIGIHSGTVDVTEWGPMGPSAVALSRDMKCSPCYLAKAADCHRGLACLRGIGVGDVHRACRRLLVIGRQRA
jgi:ADP-heptose:LPS heptosyltransferase